MQYLSKIGPSKGPGGGSYETLPSIDEDQKVDLPVLAKKLALRTRVLVLTNQRPPSQARHTHSTTDTLKLQIAPKGSKTALDSIPTPKL